jgi:hypothetical protein
MTHKIVILDKRHRQKNVSKGSGRVRGEYDRERDVCAGGKTIGQENRGKGKGH